MYIFLSILLLLFMVTIHEFGHFIVSKASKVGVTEFAVGFGPKLLQWQGKTLYALRLILLGGFCKIDDDSFNNAPWWKKELIIIAGPIMNLSLALAIIIYYGLFIHHFSILESLKYSFRIVFLYIDYFAKAITQTTLTQWKENIAGPIGAITLTSQAIAAGVADTMAMTVALNLGLFVMNMLPIPALDGGRLILVLIEAISRKAIPKKVEMVLIKTSFAIMMALIVFVTFIDILRFIK